MQIRSWVKNANEAVEPWLVAFGDSSLEEGGGGSLLKRPHTPNTAAATTIHTNVLF